MGLTTFPEIARELIAHGRSPETPAMAVRWATRPDQQTIAGTLASLPCMLGGMKPPATIIVGEVVRLREKLDWFERLPLFGKRIVVTRAREQADALGSRLSALGAGVIALPTIEIRPPADSAPLDRAIAELDTYDWLIFTSANGVRFFLDRLDAGDNDLRKLRAKICAIGPATRAAVEALHLKVDLMGKEYVAEGLLEAFAAHDLEGKRVLLPRAAVARDLVPAELARRGARVDVVEAYRTVPPEHLAEQVREILAPPPGLPHLHQFVHRAQSGGSRRSRRTARHRGGIDRAHHHADGARTRHRSRRPGQGIYRRRSCRRRPRVVH